MFFKLSGGDNNFEIYGRCDGCFVIFSVAVLSRKDWLSLPRSLTFIFVVFPLSVVPPIVRSRIPHHLAASSS